MGENRHLNYGDRLPVAYVDPIQDFIAPLAVQVRLTLANPTTVQIVAGTGDSQASLGIQGRWRWITASVNAAHPGGPAGTYDVYATGTDNVYTPTGAPPGSPPETDDTVYSFALVIRATGSPPATAIYRKIATVTWDGTKITAINQTVDGGVTLQGDVIGPQSATQVIRASGPFALTNDLTPPAITADQANYAPVGSINSGVLRLSSTANVKLTGLVNGNDGRIVVVHNVGTFAITLVGEGTASFAANRFAGPDVVLAPGESCILQYDDTSSRWRCASRRNPNYVTALPGSPSDGREVYLVADAGTGAVWHLRYNASSARWEFLGGAPKYLSSAGPYAVPYAGTYRVQGLAQTQATGNYTAQIAITVNGVPDLQESYSVNPFAGGGGTFRATTDRVIAVAAADAVALSASPGASDYQLYATPVQIH